MLYIQLIDKYMVRPQEFYWANPACKKTYFMHVIWEARRKEGSSRADAVTWKNVLSWNGVQGTVMGKSRYIWLPASGLTKSGTSYTYSQLHRSQSYLDYQCSSVDQNLPVQGLQSFLSQKPQRRWNEMTPGAALKNTAFEISESQLKFLKCNFGIILI